MLAPYACAVSNSRGRAFPEGDDPLRSAFQRDRDRIVHSIAFRRLQYKTQVFVNHEGDHFRTRLTHSLEVSQIARTLAHALTLDVALTEALALAHDLGHPPFGHAGEEALNIAMAPFGGFRHNEQTIRVLVLLEKRYARFRGLNLTWETLEGTVKHNGPLPSPVPPTIADLDAVFPLALDSYPSLEAQIASLADDIAYSTHDVDDGLRAEMFTVDDILSLPLVGELFAESRDRFKGASASQQQHEAVRRLLRTLVSDLLDSTRARLQRLAPTSSEAIRQANAMTACFSPDTEQALLGLKRFLMERMYRHYRVNRMSLKAHTVLKALFNTFLELPNTLPTEWQHGLTPGDTTANARHIADYIAGMTDRYALKEYQRLFDVSPL
jgi:dGTPase